MAPFNVTYYIHGLSLSNILTILNVYRRNSKFIDLADLVEESSTLGLVGVIQKYHNNPLEKEAESLVAGPSFLQYLTNYFKSKYQLEILYNLNGNTSKYYMLSTKGTWDEIIKLQ